MLGSAENSEQRKLVQKTDTQYKFSFAWFGKEKENEKKTSGKGTETRVKNFLASFDEKRNRNLRKHHGCFF